MQKYFWTSHLFAHFFDVLTSSIGEKSHIFSNEF